MTSPRVILIHYCYKIVYPDFVEPFCPFHPLTHLTQQLCCKNNSLHIYTNPTHPSKPS